MSHKCGRPSSTNVNLFNRKSIVACQSCPSPNRFTADSKCLSHRSETHGLHKTKQLRTRKERSQIRAASKVTLKIKSHRQHDHGCCRKDAARFHNCCDCSSVRNAPFPSVVPAVQECSIITDSRLIGHHGLFNHEVKSVDIERLLSEQKKLEPAGQHVKEKKSAALHLPSTDVKTSCPTAGLVTVDADAHVLKKPANDDGHQKRKKNLQFSDEGSGLTPEQRLQQQLDLSSGSVKSLKHSSISPVATTTKKSNHMMSEIDKKSNFTPIIDRPNVKTSSKKGKKHIISTLEQTPDSPEVPALHPQPRAISPSPLQLSTSIASDNFDAQHREGDLNCVSQSVHTVAARLCDSFQFPFQRMKNVVSESKKVLLKCLHEKHGPWLQENLLELQSSPKVSSKAVQHARHGFNVTEDDPRLPTDTFLRKTKRSHSNWKSNAPLYQTPKQMAAWLPFPEKTPVAGLEDLIRPTNFSRFCLNLEPSMCLASHSFALSPLLCHDDKASDSQHWHDARFRPKSNESLVFDSFESSFMKDTNAVREQSYGSQYCDSKMQPPFTHQDKNPDIYSMEEMYFPQHQDPFRTNTPHLTPSISAQNYHPLQNSDSNFSDFNKFSGHAHLTCWSHSNNDTDMIHFPQSRMLERGSQIPGFSFPSPEHWSFPAMRLY